MRRRPKLDRFAGLIVLAWSFLTGGRLAGAQESTWFPLVPGATWSYANAECSLRVTVLDPIELLGQTVWPVLQEVPEAVPPLPPSWIWYTTIDPDGDVVRVGYRHPGQSRWYECVPSYLVMTLPPVVGATWDPGWDGDIIVHPDKANDVLYGWDAAGTITVPAGSFEAFHCEFGWVAENVGLVVYVLPGPFVGYPPVELESFSIPPVAVRSTTWTQVKQLFE